MTVLYILLFLVGLAMLANYLSIKSSEYPSIQRDIEHPDYDFEESYIYYRGANDKPIYFFTVLFNGLDVSDKISAAVGRTGNPFSTKVPCVTWLDSGKTEYGKVRILKTGRFR